MFWSEHVIHTFTGARDGGNPGPANLVFDAAGNLYGTTERGGAYLWGAAFKLTPGSKGKWTESVLHSFTNGIDGGSPSGGLVIDSAGNLYGTTGNGGAQGAGVVYELTP